MCNLCVCEMHVLVIPFTLFQREKKGYNKIHSTTITNLLRAPYTILCDILYKCSINQPRQYSCLILFSINNILSTKKIYGTHILFSKHCCVFVILNTHAWSGSLFIQPPTWYNFVYMLWRKAYNIIKLTNMYS